MSKFVNWWNQLDEDWLCFITVLVLVFVGVPIILLWLKYVQFWCNIINP